ncbi:UbiA prenyltransferase family [Phanerochaete sordida]|uniref:UbiA prenyltransferase family n=1 Tax=Phanerochaete sordida TaxID=48140 RepID=A0A9P3G9B2_9APHY|nr:UbiA prenyltransferase family [Phanerochaete sordida]
MSPFMTLSVLAHHAHTVFLFTKADIKTTFLPIILFAVAAAPVHSTAHALRAALWLWLHLLQFNVANQIYEIDEDAMNKPHRPLPSQRIDAQTARCLRWALVPMCLVVSALFSEQVVYASAAFAVLTLVYNELHADAGFWLLRNTVNGLGFAAFEAGTTLLAGARCDILDAAAWLAIFQSAAILATTIQVQDFKDVVGDAHVGRATFPLVSESLARWSVIITLSSWSLVLAHIWELDSASTLFFGGLGVWIGVRFLFYRSIEADKASYNLYNVSLCRLIPPFVFSL